MPADNLLEDLERAADSPADLERLLNQYRTFAPARRQRALELIQRAGGWLSTIPG